MNLSLTTEYVWGPRNLEDLFKQDVSVRNLDGYHLMEQIDSTFKLDSYELAFNLENVVFQHHGRYEFRVYAGSDMFANKTFNVIKR